MYSANGSDRVVPIADLPQSSVGAPCPLVMEDELTTVVAYYVEAPEPDWTGETVRVVDLESSAEPAAIVPFRGVCVAMFGPPNDEAFAARGLRPGRRHVDLVQRSGLDALHHSWLSPASLAQFRLARG